MKYISLKSLSLIVAFPFLLNAQQVKQIQLKQFVLQSSEIVKNNGAELSTANYHSKEKWLPVTVPSTVLTGLVANKIYPNPYDGLNNMFIPDASDSFNNQYHLAQYSHIPNVPNPWKKAYWYKTSFTIPANDKGKLFQLIFKGINYRADVWLNGKLIADSSQLVGMFAEFNLNVSNAIKTGEENFLAVKIYPLDFPGLPAHPQLNALGDFYENGGPTGDIGKNVTMLCSVGWDWMPEIRDRNMGIWQPVYLRTSGNVVVQQPKITTTFVSGNDTNAAKLNIQLTLANYSKQNKQGKLQITISPETFAGNSFSITQNISVNADEQKKLEFSSNQFKQLIIQHPHIWWPHGYGNADLYKIRLQYFSGNEISDDTSFVFGIRTVDSKYSTVNEWGKRDFYVNRKRIHLVGGAWVPDMMLQEDSLRFAQELLLCKNANTNLIRIWGGGVAPPDAFFETTDRLGLLVWEDFWITGDTHGEFKGSADFPYQGNVYINNTISTIYRLRNHPSLLVWTGGNEGHARKKLYDAMRDNVALIDGTRPFVPCSSGFAHLPKDWNMSWPDNQPGGVYSGGSYMWEDPNFYYTKINEGKDWLFKDETGIPSQVPYESLSKNIVDLKHDTTLPYPFNNSWGYHDACSGNGHYDLYYYEMIKRLGAPTTLKDFSDKMQIMNADGYRGIFEAAAHKLNDNGGVLLWKLNPAFPSVIWQIFDYYLAPNAGYYFMQSANEKLHVQLNLDDSVVAVINRTFHAENNLSVDAAVYDLNGKQLFTQKTKLNIGESDVKKTISLNSILSKYTNLSFVVLNLKDAAGKLVSHNVYWFAKDHQYQSLKNITPAKLDVKIITKTKDKTNTRWNIQFTNPTKQMAFFVHPKLTEGNDEIFPGFWSGNYFTLAPGETITLDATYPNATIANKKLQLKLSGWNRNDELITAIQ
ncbi:MAG TPA: beta galactosidase jelly roll domain-containing protein [Chitinophagaceae bacterium]|nr:beta galactosidase jelly roll domain-containing protein [Chitinophagaceae bacterium]